MVDIRGFNGGLNTDAGDELFPNGDYRYAFNIRNSSEGIVNIPGNILLEGAPESSGGGSEWVCGSFFDKTRQRIIYFLNNILGYHRIISVDVNTEVHTVLFEDVPESGGAPGTLDWPRTSFNPELMIKDIRVIHREYEGDLYYFIDPNKKPCKFNYKILLQRRLGQPVDLCAFGWTNANYTGIKFRNGDTIPQVQDALAWSNLTSPAWCYYNNSSSNDSVYGKLYNWYAINDPRGFAPVGYRVPTDTDWTNLITCLGGENIAGGKMKSNSNLWATPNTGATNESFFSGLPGGTRLQDGSFQTIGLYGFWWSSTEFNANNAWYVSLGYDTSIAGRFNFNKKLGYSVRLIKEL